MTPLKARNLSVVFLLWVTIGFALVARFGSLSNADCVVLGVC
jgi:hypothetical protein